MIGKRSMGIIMVWITLLWGGALGQVVLVEAPYLVVDLSGGANVKHYPVKALTELPDPIPYKYKTSNIVLRHVPPGTFLMGSPINELGRDSDEEVEHSVTLTKPFYMGIFEVTQKQWELVMGSKPRTVFVKERDQPARPVYYVSYDDIRGSSEGKGWPAHNRVDADSFLGKLRIRTGIEFDLPTEAQWEYACRAGTIRAFNDYTQNNGEGYDCRGKRIGEDPNLVALVVHYRPLYDGPDDVGTKKANAWGLYNMHGNVGEWCLDWLSNDLGSTAVTDPSGATSGKFRAFRGGGFCNGSMYNFRSAARHGLIPDGRGATVGFRVCCAPLMQ